METKYVCSQDKTCSDTKCQGHTPNDLTMTWGDHIRMERPFDCGSRRIKSKGVYPVVPDAIELPKDLFEL